jgi:hypothetical protein
MGGRSKIIPNLNPATVVDLSDDADIEDSVDENIFHFLPDNEESDEEEKGSSEAEIQVIISEDDREAMAGRQ